MDKPAPDFQLQDQDGVTHRLSDYHGKWLVVYFYPKDDSPGCTQQACDFRDEHAIISQFGNAVIIGINKDSVGSHKKFANKHHLNFPLLSDPTRAITKAYGAWKSNKSQLIDRAYGTRRNTYLINPEGHIVKQYLGVNPKNHAPRIIEDLQILQQLVKT